MSGLLHFTRLLLLIVFFSAGTVVAGDPNATGAGDDKAAKPAYNVLLLMTDEHTAKVLGCYGDKLVQTPTLDGLAARGVRFTAAYCQNPICVPSRVSLVTGQMPCHQATFGNTDNQTYESTTTLADAFTQAGYNTAWFGKTHWGNPRFQAGSKGKRRNTDEQIGRLPSESRVSASPIEDNFEHHVADDAIAFLDSHKQGRFFLGVSLPKPHFPFTIQEKYYNLYRDKVAMPHAPARLIDELPAISKQERDKYKLGETTPADILRAKAMYYGMVTFVDEEFGRILKRLDDLGLRDNTIILYTADHGEMLGDRGLWYKNSFYDGSANIPFLWSFPKLLPQGKVITAPVMNMDIFPTLCDLCQLPKPKTLEGTSLLGLMQGTSDGADRVALSENYRGGFSGRMIRTDRWKYFFYTTGEEYLYDMKADPGEEHNLAKQADLRAAVEQLKARAMAGWLQPPKTKNKSATTGDESSAPRTGKKKAKAK